MDVPVIMLAGTKHAARVGVSLLSQVGLTNRIVTSTDDYVDVAMRLANDREQLAVMRAELHERTASSSLCDNRAFARAIENMYRDI